MAFNPPPLVFLDSFEDLKENLFKRTNQFLKVFGFCHSPQFNFKIVQTKAKHIYGPLGNPVPPPLLEFQKIKTNGFWPHLVPFQSKILFGTARFFSLAKCTIHTKHLVHCTKTQKYAPKTYRPKLYYNKL